MNTNTTTNKKAFVSPMIEAVMLDATDILRTSGGGFEGEWDTDI